jgi:uncharacterized membrane-anchored protein YjiN (DUF445 family)
MQITVEIDNNLIKELVTQEIVKQIVAERSYESREAKLGIREGIDKAIKQYIYSNKEKIIDRVVERASTEIVRKGMPKLIDAMIAKEGDGQG